MSDRTPYQRGNRDGLLWMAHHAHQRAEIYRAEVDRLCVILERPANTVQANAARRLYPTALGRLQAWADCAAEAERMSESMPEDPEVTHPAPLSKPRSHTS